MHPVRLGRASNLARSRGIECPVLKFGLTEQICSSRANLLTFDFLPTNPPQRWGFELQAYGRPQRSIPSTVRPAPRPQERIRADCTLEKALSIPFFNPLNVYGRDFLLSWWGFFVAFWSWYAFPPLLTETIKADLNLSQAEVANSNILALAAALIVRLVAGLACDRFGARWTFASILMLGATPTALAGTVTTHSGLIALRFFVGILGESFIPCQV